MRLSVVFELLLVFLFLAFAAARVIDRKAASKNVSKIKLQTTSFRQGPPNRYCACTSKMCNCCRDFSLPVVPIKGPGCASVVYTEKDTMMVSLAFGERILTNATISGKNPKPICMSLPGGISQFCGRVYGISRTGENFRACLGLELRALDDIEAALRVSCFKFGPKGVNLESAPPVPVETKDPEDDDDDDDDDDDYGLGVGDDIIGFDDDDDDDDDDDAGVSSDDNEVDSDSVDYAGFSVLSEDILGTFFSDDSGDDKKKVKTAKPQVPATVSTTTRRTVLFNRRRTTRRPIVRRPIVRTTAKPAGVKIEAKPSVVTVASSQHASSPMSTPASNGVKTPPPSTTPMDTIEKETEKGPAKEDTMATELPVTFTIPTEKNDVKNYVKIPQTDLNKIEALAAIAQQNFASGVITSGSLTADNTEEPSKETMTAHDENKFRPAPQNNQQQQFSSSTQKIISNKFAQSDVVTAHASVEMENDSAKKPDSVETKPETKPVMETTTTVRNQIPAGTKASIVEGSNKNEEVYDETESDEVEGSEEEETEEEEEAGTGAGASSSQHKHETSTVAKVDQKLTLKNDGSDLKKQQIQQEIEQEDEEEDDDDDDGEDDDDLLSGIIDDDTDDSEDVDASEEVEESGSAENDNKLIRSTTTQRTTDKSENDKNDENENDDEDDEDGDEDENDDDVDDEVAEILGETPVNEKKKKVTKVPVSKRPQSSQGSKDEDDEHDGDEGILDLLDVDDSESVSPEQSSKNKKKPNDSGKNTTVKIKDQPSSTRKPTTGQQKIQKPQQQNGVTGNPAGQHVAQTILTKLSTTSQRITQNSPNGNSNSVKQTTPAFTLKAKKPAGQKVNDRPIPTRETTTEKMPQTSTTETTTLTTVETSEKHDSGEQVFTYQPENMFTEKVFTFTHPGNKFSQKLPQGIYQVPTEQKFVIYNEPEEKATANPAGHVYEESNNATETNEKTEEGGETIDSDEEGDTVEDGDEDDESEKDMLIASLMKKNPTFGNRYEDADDDGNVHNSGETDDLDIEESEDEEGSDFEDRKIGKRMKGSEVTSSPSSPTKNLTKTASSIGRKFLKLDQFLTQPKRFYKPPSDRPISASRTHRRMNLDRFAEG